MSYIFRDYRCIYCNKLFFKGELIFGKIEIKCRHCKRMISIETEINKQTSAIAD